MDNVFLIRELLSFLTHIKLAEYVCIISKYASFSLSFPPLPPLRRREEKEEDGGLEEREREKEREDARRDNREMVSIARGKWNREEEEEEHKKSFKRVSERKEITVTFWYFFPREVRISFPFSFSRLGRLLLSRKKANGT